MFIFIYHCSSRPGIQSMFNKYQQKEERQKVREGGAAGEHTG